MFDDLRFGWRLWRRKPMFALAAVLTLVLGVALNTSLFGVVNAVWFRPLGFPQPDRLVFLNEFHARNQVSELVSPSRYSDWLRNARSFEAIGALGERSVTLSGDHAPERLRGAIISASLPAILGFQPVLGRNLTEQDEDPAAPPVVLISQRFWEERYGAARDIIGKQLRIDGTTSTIVGVAPYGFRLRYSGYQVLEPLRPTGARNVRFLEVVARLGPEVTLSQARSEMESITRRLEEQYPATEAGWRARVERLKDAMWADARPLYLVLLAASGLLLLLICANLSNLMLARATGRRKEVAVRLALGATRGRIVRQMFVEGSALSLVGGALAFLLCVWVRSAVVSAYPEMKELAVDLRVFAFNLGVSLASGLALGLVPALAVSKPDVNSTLKQAGPESGKSHLRLGATLTVVQLALASALLMSAGLLVRSIYLMRSVDPGFETSRLLTASLTLPPARYEDGPRQLAFLETILDRVSTLPGVTSTAGATTLPLLGGTGQLRLQVEGRSSPPGGDSIGGAFTATSAQYFRTLGIKVERGRVFDPRDRIGAPMVAVVNQAFVRALWADSNRALGSRIRIDACPWRQVVGIVSDARQVLIRPPLPEIYVPLAQQAGPSIWLALRTAGPAVSAAPALREAIRQLDPDLPISYVQSMEMVVEEYFPRPVLLVLGAFSIIALALGGMGLYGVVSFSVASRTREFGVRLALGADRTAVWRLVLGQGARLTAVGLVAGLGAALALGRALARYLFGVKSTDPLVFGAVCIILGAIALAACAAPARRATRVDPAVALRCE